MDFEALFPMRVCMNLARRPDRWERAQAAFWNEELAVDRWDAVDGQRVRNAHGFAWPSRYAVSLTKRMIVRAARMRKAEAVFLFEDDVVFHHDWRRQVERLHLPDDWGMFMLGCQHIARPQPVAPGLLRVTGAVDNHAIGIRREWYERVLLALRHGREEARRWPHTASDRHLAALMEEVPAYAPWPNLAWQRPEVSDQTGSRYSQYDQNGLQIPGRHLLRHLDGFWEPASSPAVPPPPLKPWMRASEVAFLEATLRPDMAVLEFGSGGTTAALCGRVRLWHAIEHDAGWHRRICEAVPPGRASIHFVPPAWPQEHAFSPAQPGQFAAYARKCLHLGVRFDAVIVDGRARVDCALHAARVLKPGGWLFFHDYFTRTRYLRRAAEMQPLYRMVKAFRHTPQTMAVFRRRTEHGPVA